jgi:hypothetical protein
MAGKLVFQRHDGSQVTADAPGGGIRPGEYVFVTSSRTRINSRAGLMRTGSSTTDRPSLLLLLS